MSESKLSVWQRTTDLWVSRTGLDWETYKMVLKDTIAPAIGLAANQATPWSDVFGTIGFIVPMASIISHPSPPRAEFLRIWIANILGSCVSAAVTALAFFCIIKAREQSEGPAVDPKDVPYNAVASTVAAIWLIVQVYVTSAIRYNYPWTTWMVSACLIFSNYGMVYVVQFPDMTAAYRFLRQLLFAHLVGFAISAGVSLFVFPVNSRERFCKTASACTEEIRLALHTNIELMECTADATDSAVLSGLDAARKQHKEHLDSLQVKLVVQLKDAQNEVAWGILAPADLSTLTHLLEEIIIPLIGLCRVPDIVEGTLRDGDSNEKEQKQSCEQYRDLLGSVIKTFSQASAAADAGLRSSENIIGLNIPTHSVKGDEKTPLQQLQHGMDLLVESKADLLTAWRTRHGIPDGGSAINNQSQDEFAVGNYDQSRANLHMLLYTEFLLWSICHRVRELLVWVEELKACQKLDRDRLIIPEWTKPCAIIAFISRRWMGKPGEDGSKARRRSIPSPRTIWTFALYILRKCALFFASPASGFALRVAAATMSVAIVAYLPSTQSFYIKQHLVWAQYAVSYAMQGSAGQGIRALVFRMSGTTVAVCLAWISWYIVSGIPTGVLVFYWLSLHFSVYIMALKPRYSTVGTVSAFALTTVLGNALQPNGSKQTTIVLGAVRLAAIGGGCLLATTWTLFPFPVSDYDGARSSLGACLACLAEYHTGFHEIVRIRLGEGLKQGSPGSRSREPEDAHSRLMVKCTSHLQNLRTRLRLAKWDTPTDHAPFSHSDYEYTCGKLDDLIRNMQLITFATRSFVDFTDTRTSSTSNSSLDWLVDFRDLFNTAQRDGLGAATLLGLLAHSVRNQMSLPPYLVAPGPEKLWKYFDDPTRVAQQVMRVDDPGAAMFALMRIGMKGLYRDLGELLQVVRKMVGEFDFVCGFAVNED